MNKKAVLHYLQNISFPLVLLENGYSLNAPKISPQYKNSLGIADKQEVNILDLTYRNYYSHRQFFHRN